jgi:hypothetical protein
MSTAGAVTERKPSEGEDLKQCFDEWMSGIKMKISGLAAEQHDPSQIAASLGMSEKAFLVVLMMMVREGSIRITGIHPNTHDNGRRKDND